MRNFNGTDLIRMGFKPGSYFREALAALKEYDADITTCTAARSIIASFIPEPLIEMRCDGDSITYQSYLPPAENETEARNSDAVYKAMETIIRVPTVVKAAVMPDACPAGTIPVGGVVATENAIHPSYHSADVCCSMAITILEDNHDPKSVLDIIEQVTHFGPTEQKNKQVNLEATATECFDKNQFLKGLEGVAHSQFGTQGDGNHFYFVGHLESTGQLAIISHHGSRKLGALVFKRGKVAAERETKKIAPDVPKQHAWLDTRTDIGAEYWDALLTVREWTKRNHFDVHNLVTDMIRGSKIDRFWNPHNFVFRKRGLWVHAKGATPSYQGHSFDDEGRTLIPMNMAEPILITKHTDKFDSLGFAPHGAGRNMSRTQFMRENNPISPTNIDVRFWSGNPDPSELPDAYKNSSKIIAQINKHRLASIVDRVMPYGSIMAGDCEKDAPWRKK